MAKINLDNVRGVKTFSVLADKEYENGAIVGLGDLEEGEYNLYKAVPATDDNLYLITTPEVHRDSKSDSLDFVNKKGSHMRVHQLEKGDVFTVETAVQPVTTTAGQKLSASGNAFADAVDGGVAVVLEPNKLGGDQREAVSIRVL